MTTIYNYTDTDHGIITISHIDESHARSASFPAAESIDGRFAWNSLSDGYVRVLDLDCSIYLQYGAQDGFDPDLLADAREFAQAIDDCRSARRAADERAELDRIEAQPTPPPEVLAMAQRYQWSADAAWEAEDEESWVLLRQWGY